jgi:hypothetical protein
MQKPAATILKASAVVLVLTASGFWLVSLRQVRTIQCHKTNWRQATELAAARIAFLRAKHEVDNGACHLPAKCAVNDAVCLEKNAYNVQRIADVQTKLFIEVSDASANHLTQGAASGRVSNVPLASTANQAQRLP